MSKPRSWKEALAHPDIDHLDNWGKPKKGSPDEFDPYLWIQLKDHVENPHTGEQGGGFFISGLKDLTSLTEFWN